MQNSSILPPSPHVSTSITTTPTSTATTITPIKLVSNDTHIATETMNSTTIPSVNDVNISILNINKETENEEEEIAAAVAQHDTHDLSVLEDLLKESYEKLMKVELSPSQILADNGFETSHTTLPTTTSTLNTTFGNNCMALNSNFSELISATAGMTNNTNFDINYQHSALETINEDSIKELLYGHVG